MNIHSANANVRDRHAYEADVARSLDRTGGYAPNQGGTLAVSIHPDAIGRDGKAKTPSIDAEGAVRLRDAGLGVQEDVSYTLGTGAPPAVFGDVDEGDRCAYDPQPDGRRYAACGDGVVANVAEWIARRIIEYGWAA